MAASAANKVNLDIRLPHKILEKVFEFRKSEKDLIAAAQVCKEWRTTLTSAQQLWTKINFC